MSILEREIHAEEELSKTLTSYVGTWVALREHSVVASAPTLHELLELVGETEIDGVIQVVEERGAASFF
jgi:hypothetical protein